MCILQSRWTQIGCVYLCHVVQGSQGKQSFVCYMQLWLSVGQKIFACVPVLLFIKPHKIILKACLLLTRLI
jgi:hypothetical protein